MLRLLLLDYSVAPANSELQYSACYFCITVYFLLLLRYSVAPLFLYYSVAPATSVLQCSA
jgi:hypothetical protein